MDNNDFLPYKECIDWLDRQMHFPMYNKKLKVTFDIFDGMKLIETYKFKPKEFSDLLNRIVPSTDIKYAPTLVISGDRKVPEIIGGKTVMKDLHLDVAITYINDANTSYDTYCNYGVTIDGGVHLDAVNRAFCNYMVTKTRSTMTDNQKDKTPIIWDDVKSGLCCVISLTTSAQVSFQGNAKTKIGNDALIPFMVDIMQEELKKSYDDNPSIIDAYIKIIKLNAKARVEAQEMKTAIQTEKMNTFKDLLLDKYTPANNHGKGQYRCLFLCEGDSAGGSMRDGGNPATDAILRLRGVTVNAAKCKNVADLMKNREVSTLVNVLRCGVGKNFNIDNLWFDRIYIATDADTDGDGISDQLITIFYLFFPEIIKAGKLYKLLNPLYHLDDGSKQGIYAKNKEELIRMYHSKIVKKFKIKLNKEDDWFTKDELREFLEDTYDYRESLIRAAESLGNTDKFLVEIAIAYLVLLADIDENIDMSSIVSNTQLMNKYMSIIKKTYKEIYLDDDNNLRGIVEGKYRKIKLSDRFLKKTIDLIPVYKKYGYKIIVQEKDSEPIVLTIAEFLDSCMRLYPRIISRYKGLKNRI